MGLLAVRNIVVEPNGQKELRTILKDGDIKYEGMRHDIG